MELFYKILFALSFDVKDMDRYYRSKEQARIAKEQASNATEAVASSPIYGILGYGAGAIILFIGLVLVIFVLIMLLKR